MDVQNKDAASSQLTDELRDDLRKSILKHNGAVTVGDIVMETGLPYGDVASDLVMMEIDGLVKSMPGGIYRIVR